MRKKLVILLILVSMLVLSFGSLQLMASVEATELLAAQSGVQFLVAEGTPKSLRNGIVVLLEGTPKPLGNGAVILLEGTPKPL